MLKIWDKSRHALLTLVPLGLMASTGHAQSVPVQQESAVKVAGAAHSDGFRAVALRQLVGAVASSVGQRFAASGLKTEDFAFSVVDMGSGSSREVVGFRGDVPIYPASVVKLFYLGATHRWLQDGKIQDSPELRRGLRDMIVDSSNDATSYILDALTDTGSGPELAPDQFAIWSEKRNAVNRFWREQGYTNINVNQKPWNEGPYGRERQFVGANYENRNKLTTDATAQLLSRIVTGDFVTPDRCKQMMELLKRDPAQKNNEDPQVAEFTGIALKNIPGAKLWSKAGWTSTTRHDAAYIEIPASTQHPQGIKLVVAIFTSNHSKRTDIIPAVVTALLDGWA